MIYFGCIYYVDPYLTPSRRKKQGRIEKKKVGSVKKMFSYVSEMIHTKNQTGTPCLQTFTYSPLTNICRLNLFEILKKGKNWAKMLKALLPF